MYKSYLHVHLSSNPTTTLSIPVECRRGFLSTTWLVTHVHNWVVFDDAYMFLTKSFILWNACVPLFIVICLCYWNKICIVLYWLGVWRYSCLCHKYDVTAGCICKLGYKCDMNRHLPSCTGWGVWLVPGVFDNDIHEGLLHAMYTGRGLQRPWVKLDNAWCSSLLWCPTHMNTN